MNDSIISGAELWELADRLSAAHPSGNPNSVESVAEAFGVSQDVVQKHLSDIRNEAYESHELTKLKAENASLKKQLGLDVSPSDQESAWIDEKTETKIYGNGYVETVRVERTRQPTWTPLLALLVFAVLAFCMFSWFNSARQRMRFGPNVPVDTLPYDHFDRKVIIER